MKGYVCLIAILAVLLCSAPLHAQVTTKTGSIYGKVIDDKGGPLPGVTINLESEVIPGQTAMSGAAGGFRFANLPPGIYSVSFSIEGFTEVRQEDVRVSIGSEVQIQMKLNPSISESFVVTSDGDVIDQKKTGLGSAYSREYLDDVPSGRDPWVIIDQTTGIDSDRYNVAGSESGQQAAFIARGGNDDNNIWNYDGVNVTDPSALGGSPSYFDFDSFEEMQISTGGNDASIPTGGVAVNIVSKRAGNKWEANGSFYFVNDSLQGNNTPDELKALGQTKSNRIDEVKDYGFDLGGPILKDKLFAWGAFHKNDIGLITTAGLPDKTKLTIANFKTNMSWNASNESQFSYNNDNKEKSGRAGISVGIQAPETLWEQGGSKTILQGIFIGQHTYIPNDHTILTARYGYNGNGFTLIPEGGKDKPMILLNAIPHYEQTLFFIAPIDRPGKDLTVDGNYFKENILGGDHELKFGFEYKTDSLHTFSSYGNGVLLVDNYQTTPGGPLTSGYAYARHDIDGRDSVNRTSVYATDTYRRGKMTLNLGVRFDHQTGKNDASSINAVPGFESFVGPVDFSGSDPGITFNDISPRIGATFDLTGDGKTILRGNFARYYDTFNSAFVARLNPTFTYNGAIFSYTNSNGDREITPDEITSGPSYYGGLNGPIFDIAAFEANKLTSSGFHNSNDFEYILGFERQLASDLSVSFNYTHRDYRDPSAIVPFGISASDFAPAGTYTANTVLGNFSVPYYQFSGEQDGSTILTNINDYKQAYNGVDISVRKRMSNNFMLNGGLTLQRQKSKYNGGDSAGFYIGDGGINGTTFPFDPTNLQFLDGQPYAFAPGGSGKSGVYPYSEWQVKLNGVYQFPYDISAGAFARYQQGYPFVLFATIPDSSLVGALGTSSHLIMVEPFGSRRYDNIFTLDLQFEKGFEMGEYGRLSLAANFFNVTNTNTVIRRTRTVGTASFNRLEENISPRAVRLGVRYSF